MELSYFSIIPFCLMLLSIAVCPLFMSRLWEKDWVKGAFVVVLCLPIIIYMCSIGMGESVWEQVAHDYFPFIILLLSLFVVSGGIHFSGDIPATPLVNSIVLIGGYLLASLMGTTGAAMLLIRPLLEINTQRRHKTHTVLFFIAMVANCGGILSPLGDPPLFLLYLRGVPFDWFMSLVPEWSIIGVMLIVAYYIADKYYYSKERPEDIEADNTRIKPMQLSGGRNLLFLGAILAAVVFLNQTYIPLMAQTDAPFFIKFLREEVLILIVVLSWITTPKSVRKDNGYSWAPISEVAILFIGIFVTMTPALMILNHHAAALGLNNAWQFYYATGGLSSVLDNSPTAVAFYSVARGLVDSGLASSGTLIAGIEVAFLRAIAMGAVFMGSMTYIGNGPNFMVKAIAERSGVKMPSFLGYITHFALPILLPIFIIIQLIFL